MPSAKRPSYAFAVLCLVLTCGILHGQTTTRLTVNGPRPLAEVANQLETLSGIPINHEDVRYENAADVQDVTESVVKPEYRARHKSGAPIKVLGPRGGELSLSVEVDAAGRPVDLSTALVAALAAHKAKGFPGAYTLVRESGAFALSPVKSILETPVTLAPVPRSAAETLKLILDGVSKASGFQVDVGMIPLNGFIPRTVTIGAWNESAKSVLLRLFAEVAPAKTVLGGSATTLSYRLLFDPGDKAYALNIHGIRPVKQ